MAALPLKSCRKKVPLIKAQVVLLLLCCFFSRRRGGGVGREAGHFYCQVPLLADQLMQRRFLALSGEEEVAADVGTGLISNQDLLGCCRMTPLFCLALFFRSGKEKKNGAGVSW